MNLSQVDLTFRYYDSSNIPRTQLPHRNNNSNVFH